MSEIHRRGIDVRELDTVLAEDFEFEGEMEFSKPLMLKGKFKGEIRATSDFIFWRSRSVGALESTQRFSGNRLPSAPMTSASCSGGSSLLSAVVNGLKWKYVPVSTVVMPAACKCAAPIWA